MRSSRAAADALHALLCSPSVGTTPASRCPSPGALARGDACLFLRFPAADYREKIWDHAAGAVIVTEAGGRITDGSGALLDFGRGRCRKRHGSQTTFITTPTLGDRYCTAAGRKHNVSASNPAYVATSDVHGRQLEDAKSSQTAGLNIVHHPMLATPIMAMDGHQRCCRHALFSCIVSAPGQWPAWCH